MFISHTTVLILFPQIFFTCALNQEQLYPKWVGNLKPGVRDMAASAMVPYIHHEKAKPAFPSLNPANWRHLKKKSLCSVIESNNLSARFVSPLLFMCLCGVDIATATTKLFQISRGNNGKFNHDWFRLRVHSILFLLLNICDFQYMFFVCTYLSLNVWVARLWFLLISATILRCQKIHFLSLGCVRAPKGSHVVKCAVGEVWTMLRKK